MTLTLKLFGAPVLHLNGNPVPLSRRKAMALLSFLAVTRNRRLSEPIGKDIVGVIDAIAGQARVSGRLGELDRSEQLAEQALKLSRGIGNRLQTGRALIELARARRLLGDRASARNLLEESFAMLSHRHWGYLQERCALLLFNLALDDEDRGAAERWFQEVSILDAEGTHYLELSEKLAGLHSGFREEAPDDGDSQVVPPPLGEPSEVACRGFPRHPTMVMLLT